MNPPRAEMVGRRFGKLVVTAEAGPHRQPNGTPNRMFHVKCDCGNTKIVRGENLRAGTSKSCGCSHGARHGETGAREYKIWRGMMQRCRRPKAKGFANYGGRGIKVCDRWSEGDGTRSGYECFLADVGRRPSPAHSLDRKDGDGHYEPGNTQWALDPRQRATKRNTHTVIIEDVPMSLMAACQKLHLSYTAIKKRVARGQSPQQALGIS